MKEIFYQYIPHNIYHVGAIYQAQRMWTLKFMQYQQIQLQKHTQKIRCTPQLWHLLVLSKAPPQYDLHQKHIIPIKKIRKKELLSVRNERQYCEQREDYKQINLSWTTLHIQLTHLSSDIIPKYSYAQITFVWISNCFSGYVLTTLRTLDIRIMRKYHSDLEFSTDTQKSTQADSK